LADLIKWIVLPGACFAALLGNWLPLVAFACIAAGIVLAEVITSLNAAKA